MIKDILLAIKKIRDEKKKKEFIYVLKYIIIPSQRCNTKEEYIKEVGRKVVDYLEFNNALSKSFYDKN